MGRSPGGQEIKKGGRSAGEKALWFTEVLLTHREADSLTAWQAHPSLTFSSPTVLHLSQNFDETILQKNISPCTKQA